MAAETKEAVSITMNVSLPEPLKRYVDVKVSSGMYGSASEFVREAIREKLERDRERASLTEKLLEGLDGGPSVPFTNGYFANRKRALKERELKRRTARGKRG